MPRHSATERVTITIAEFLRNPERYQDIALTRPVVIIQDGGERTVLLSVEEYSRLKRRDRRAIAAGELSERQVEAVRVANVPTEYARLDEELSGWEP